MADLTLLDVFEWTADGGWRGLLCAPEPAATTPLRVPACAAVTPDAPARVCVARARARDAPSAARAMCFTDTQDDLPDDVRSTFGMPLADAAIQLKMSRTSLKLLCRSKGLKQWPYRTMKSLQRMRSHVPEVEELLRNGPPYNVTQSIKKKRMQLAKARNVKGRGSKSRRHIF
jgi:hypothetical protein